MSSGGEGVGSGVKQKTHPSPLQARRRQECKQIFCEARSKTENIKTAHKPIVVRPVRGAFIGVYGVVAENTAVVVDRWCLRLGARGSCCIFYVLGERS